jgi:hypothetical protein
MRSFTLSVAAVALLLAASAASGKDFDPGDLRVCDASRCVAIVNPDVLPQLGSFYYSGPSLARARPPALGAPCYELRFRNGYVTGIVATHALSRFLSYGVHLERFRSGRWYALPRPLSKELRRLTVGLRPLHLTPAAIARSR